MTKPASDVAFRYGNPACDCDGALIRAQCRHLALVVTISGEIDEANVERVSQYIRRFILAEKPLVLDLSGVDSFAAQSISLLYAVDQQCRTAGVEWFLIAGQPVVRALRTFDDPASFFPIAGSVPEALHHFADAIGARRQLLPLLSKTA